MRVPGRLHITWQDDNTLRIDTDAGTQTRLLAFRRERRRSRRRAVLAGQSTAPVGIRAAGARRAAQPET